jgi:GNAT superfamily N-acetyltransferase
LQDDQIKIEKIKLKDICNFADRALSQTPYPQVVPISMRRALSQVKNPYGRPDDIALLVAFSAGRCVGYHGLLPGLLKQGDTLNRVHWATAFYVAPEFRGQKIGKRLLEEIKNLKIDFIVPQMTESAERAYRNTGYKDIGRLTYFQLRADRLDIAATRFGAAGPSLENINHRPKPLVAGLKRMQQAIYRGAKSVFYSTAIKNQRHLEHRFKWKVVDRLDESCWRPCTGHSNLPSFFRNIEAVNWMLQYPWVVSKKSGEKKTKNYYFSEVRNIFKYVAIEVYRLEDRKPAGFMVLSVSHKKAKTRIKLLDFYLQNEEDPEIVGYPLLKYAKKFLADRIEYPDYFAKYFQSLPWTKKLIKRQIRLYLFHPSGNESPLAVSRGKILFGYCDGDTAFV